MANPQVETHNERGIQLVCRGWQDEALSEFQKAIEKDPSYAPARDNLANLYAEKGDLLTALKTYVGALEIDPENATIHYNLAGFLKNYASELAETEYRTAISQESDFQEAYLNLGVSLAERGDYSEAIQAFEKAISLDPEDASAYYELAQALVQTNQIPKAIKSLRHATRLNPDLQEAWVLLDKCYRQQGFLEEANQIITSRHRIRKHTQK